MPIGINIHGTAVPASAPPKNVPAGMKPTFTPVRKSTRPTNV